MSFWCWPWLARARRATRHAALPDRRRSRTTANQHYVMISAATGSPYWIDSKAGLYDKAKELGVSAIFTGPPTVDVNQQIDAVNRAIAQKVDGIIMVPMADAVTPAINEAIDGRHPRRLRRRRRPLQQAVLLHRHGKLQRRLPRRRAVGQDCSAAAAKVALMFIPGTDHLTQRLNGYKDALAKYPDIKIVARRQRSRARRPRRRRSAARSCRRVPTWPASAAWMPSAAKGPPWPSKQAGKVGKVKIVAMDRDEATLQFIEEGVIDASIGQRTYTDVLPGAANALRSPQRPHQVRRGLAEDRRQSAADQRRYRQLS